MRLLIINTRRASIHILSKPKHYQAKRRKLIDLLSTNVLALSAEQHVTQSRITCTNQSSRLERNKSENPHEHTASYSWYFLPLRASRATASARRRTRRREVPGNAQKDGGRQYVGPTRLFVSTSCITHTHTLHSVSLTNSSRARWRSGFLQSQIHHLSPSR